MAKARARRRKPPDAFRALLAAWEADLQSEAWAGDQSPRDYVYASGRRTCVRAMCLDLLHPEDRRIPDVDGLERMRKGKEREVAMVARLIQLGPRCAVPFEVIEGQKRFEIRDRDGTLLLVGKLEGRLRFRNGERPVFEVKSGQSFARATSLEDLDRSPWTRHALDQLLAYLYREGEPWGFFIIDRPGMPLFLRVNLEDHLGRTEGFLRAARVAVDARFGRVALPAPVQDRAECRRCDHLGKSCSPEWDTRAATVIIDEELIEAAETRERCAAAAAEFDRADRRLKDALRGVTLGILGPYEVTGEWSRSTRYEIPTKVKQRYRIIDEKGRFTLSIERMLGGNREDLSRLP